MTEDNLPETLTEAIRFFAEGDNALVFFVGLRWPNGVTCPTCGSAEVRYYPTVKRWECKHKHERRQFSVKVGTVMEDSPIKLDKWLCVLWMLTGAKNGISSYEVHRALKVTQKTAWFMLHRLRLALQEGFEVRDKMRGTVEVDESWIGGRARLMNKKTKARAGIGKKGAHGKTPVMGLLEKGTRKRCSRVRAEVIRSADKEVLDAKVRQYVLKGATVHTDQHMGYADLGNEYVHGVVNHAVSYARDGVHTNGLENFWSLLKRTIKGTYVSVEPFHLFRYLAEQSPSGI